MVGMRWQPNVSRLGIAEPALRFIRVQRETRDVEIGIAWRAMRFEWMASLGGEGGGKKFNPAKNQASFATTPPPRQMDECTLGAHLAYASP
jgi:hypothetical protein